MADDGPTKRVSIVDRLKGLVTQIRGRDRSQPVVFENIFNQIHAARQMLARRDTEYDDGACLAHCRNPLLRSEDGHAWEAMRSKFGTQPLAELLAPAIYYAENGFPLSETIANGWANCHGAWSRARWPRCRRGPIVSSVTSRT